MPTVIRKAQSILVILCVFLQLEVVARGEAISEEDAWYETTCSDMENVVTVSTLYRSIYGPVDLCRDVVPEVIPGVQAEVRKLRSRHRDSFRLFDESPYLAGAKKAVQRQNQKARGEYTDEQLRALCGAAAKKLHGNAPVLGEILEKWAIQSKTAVAPRSLGPRSARWVDEALLHDGRTVEVTREIALPLDGSCKRTPDGYSLEANNPDTGKLVKWSGEKYVLPVLLDFVDRTAYLAVNSNKVFSNPTVYGCPETPYAFLKYDDSSSRWIPVPKSEIPRISFNANLSFRYDSYRVRDGLRQPKEAISRYYEEEEKSSRGYVSQRIPTSIQSWGYARKERFKNERVKDDCRPPLPEPVDSINPKDPAPLSQPVTLEFAETRNYDPEWVIKEDPNAEIPEWSRLSWDKERYLACKQYFRPADPDNSKLDGWVAFVNDPSRSRITRSHINAICDTGIIWMWDYVAEPQRTVLIKVKPSGEVIYRASFAKPTEPWGYLGHIMLPTLKAKDGYVSFEWWNTNQSGRDRHVRRSIKVRFREPQ